MAIGYTSRERTEVHKFSPLVAVIVPLLALFIQAFFPLRIQWFAIFDFPLLITIFFAVARRSPITGLLTGAVIGTFQDALTNQPIGVYGISKTVIGYLASSIGKKIDVENPGSRILLAVGFYIVHQAIFMVITKYMIRLDMEWRWGHTLVAGLANGLMAVTLFALLDRLKQRA